MNKLKLILSFDYELPLGHATNYNKGLFDPASNLLNLAKELKIPINLFADVCSAMKFRKWNEKAYFIPFVSQVQTAIKDGNDVQLHIHPHWMNSQFKDGDFIPSKFYTLSDFKNEPSPLTIPEIIDNSAAFLKEICSEAASNYKCIAYRGGGFNLEPDTKTILSQLYKNGIRMDSSIIKGFYWRPEFLLADYRKTPKQANWILDLDGDFSKPGDSGILEIPIIGKPKNFITNFPDKQKRKKHKDRIYNHEGKGYGTKLSGLTIKDIIRASFSPRMFSFDSNSTELKDLLSIRNEIICTFVEIQNVCKQIILFS